MSNHTATMSITSSVNGDTQSYSSNRFCPVSFKSERLERYERGGFHPVHLGDYYDNGRYRIVHKLGAGGLSTVWLAQDEMQLKWVALKIIVADESDAVLAKVRSPWCTALQENGAPFCVLEERYFSFLGPNGQHLCLVMPVLGSNTLQSSGGTTSRMQPRLVRKVTQQVAHALTDLHAQGVCHGDVTPSNILFRASGLDQLNENGIYRFFGRPETAPLETEYGERVLPGTPRYVVKPMNFLSPGHNFIERDIRLADFDLSFETAAPPTKMLGMPMDYLAPEVAIGQEPGPASDVWALGCCIFRLRSGQDLFYKWNLDIDCPENLFYRIARTLGNPPRFCIDTLFDDDGYPTRDSTRGQSFDPVDVEQSLSEWVSDIQDQPEHDLIHDGTIRRSIDRMPRKRYEPYHARFSDMLWNPEATKIENTNLEGCGNHVNRRRHSHIRRRSSSIHREAFEHARGFSNWPPRARKISKHEAALLFDLLSRIFVYDPKKRITARDMLSHPWFRLDNFEERAFRGESNRPMQAIGRYQDTTSSRMW